MPLSSPPGPAYLPPGKKPPSMPSLLMKKGQASLQMAPGYCSLKSKELVGQRLTNGKQGSAARKLKVIVRTGDPAQRNIPKEAFGALEMARRRPREDGKQIERRRDEVRRKTR